ncbi:tRNA (guanosine(46)-N7)-methyltransferase TrmB [Oceanirhabdus sp. W0125-5]|uniref:tRNA (guanosine(46)-N7)-methyltransferase TrmB n=1 Tax=Oceanirhabdus sp. W0125-5 TaxID=2999116 RepID=UPI0022F32B49|nr:tRNA (guanosine(46)-N7)-methyltransferase TrmB [Oceanirhabdus sp. W0125-5]WBW98934.1 tRNA (guanosine(46)-N7)-methyltransferase TrmB [Oceanirhabdus sp. W0125-5]
MARLRKKWWARDAMETSGVFIEDNYAHKGKWNEVFGNDNDIYLELGCGRGDFVVNTAAQNPDKNFIAVDLKDEVLCYLARKCKEMNLNNVRFMALNIMLIQNVFDKDEVKRIYLNFSTPWPKTKHNKRRLSHPKFLELYAEFLAPKSEIWLKSDDKPFFVDSAYYFKDSGYKLSYLTYDLHNSIYADKSVRTEYETKFSAMGKKINFLIAKMK